jgi:hypothetical protein
MHAARTLRGIVAATVLILTIISVAKAEYGGGSGTRDNPYQIWTPEQMDAIGTDPNNWGKHFKLMADIDLSAYSGSSFHLIGSRWGPGGIRPFTGVFDGDGHTISGLSYSTQEQYPIGLFIYIGYGGFGSDRTEVKNLRLAGVNIDAPKADRVGVLVGSLTSGAITNCSAVDATVAGNSYVGGLIGESNATIRDCSYTGSVTSSGIAGGLVGATDQGAILDCRFEGTVTGQNSVGGLVGWNRISIISCGAAGSVTGNLGVGGCVGYNYGWSYDYPGNITSCWSAAFVKGTDARVGGFIGENASGTIKSCWASGSVEGDSEVGGFAGWASGIVSDCYASGPVRGQTNVGGFAGSTSSSSSYCYSIGRVSGEQSIGGFTPAGSPYQCYWDVQTSGTTQGAGQGKTTAEMMTAATFIGWGYEGLWTIAEGIDYPRLVWENSGGDPLIDPQRTYGGGTGEPNDPYLIDTPEQLISISFYRADFSKHFLFTADLDFNSIDLNEFVPLTINGTLDGGGHHILNFRYLADQHGTVGLLGTVGPAAIVRNLHMVNVRVAGAQAVGALVARNSGRVQDCSVTGTVEGQSETGGLVGYNTGQVIRCTAEVQVTGKDLTGALVGHNTGWVEACSAGGRIVGESSVGGLVGSNDKEIISSYSTADVTGQKEVGSLVGTAGRARFWQACPAPPAHFVPGLSDSRITACYSTGQVSGQQSLGGLIGKNAGVVTGCYAACPVLVTAGKSGSPATVNADAGGLVGKNEYGVVYLSYWDTQVSGLLQSAGGRGRTTARMQTADTFNGWDAFNVWAIEEGRSYPYFQRMDPSGRPMTADPHRYAAGTGMAADPYQIQTPQQWLSIGYHRDDWDKHFILMNDLDLREIDPNAVWTIGIPTTPFIGVFDGNGHTIANFTLRHDGELYVGMFGCLGSALLAPYATPGSISNLRLANADVHGFCHVGGLAGYNDKGGDISACSVGGHVAATGKDAGGLVGYNLGSIKDCSSTCAVTAQEVAGTLTGYNGGTVASSVGSGRVRTTGSRDSYAGGLVGDNGGTIQLSHFVGSVLGKYTAGGLAALNEGTIWMCSARATVTGTYLLGGLVGYNESGRTIIGSFASGTTIGGNAAGGLVGHNAGTISNCFAAGQVRGDERIGGLVGSCSDATEIRFCYSSCLVKGRNLVAGFVGELPRWDKVDITSCFWDIDSSTMTDGVATADPDPSGVLGLRRSNMRAGLTAAVAPWGFVGKMDVWKILDGQDYPRLSWEAASKRNDTAK